MKTGASTDPVLMCLSLHLKSLSWQQSGGRDRNKKVVEETAAPASFPTALKLQSQSLDYNQGNRNGVSHLCSLLQLSLNMHDVNLQGSYYLCNYSECCLYLGVSYTMFCEHNFLSHSMIRVFAYLQLSYIICLSIYLVYKSIK